MADDAHRVTQELLAAGGWRGDEIPLEVMHTLVSKAARDEQVRLLQPIRHAVAEAEAAVERQAAATQTAAIEMSVRAMSSVTPSLLLRYSFVTPPLLLRYSSVTPPLLLRHSSVTPQ